MGITDRNQFYDALTGSARYSPGKNANVREGKTEFTGRDLAILGGAGVGVPVAALAGVRAMTAREAPNLLMQQLVSPRYRGGQLGTLMQGSAGAKLPINFSALADAGAITRAEAAALSAGRGAVPRPLRAGSPPPMGNLFKGGPTGLPSKAAAAETRALGSLFKGGPTGLPAPSTAAPRSVGSLFTGSAGTRLPLNLQALVDAGVITADEALAAAGGFGAEAQAAERAAATLGRNAAAVGSSSPTAAAAPKMALGGYPLEAAGANAGRAGLIRQLGGSVADWKALEGAGAKAGSILKVPAGLTGRKALTAAAGKAAWALAPLQVGMTVDDPGESLIDRYNESGVAGDVFSGAAKGAGAGAGIGMLGGPFAPISVPLGTALGAVGGGLLGWATGDRNEAENLRKDAETAINAYRMQFDASVNAGFLDPEEVTAAHTLYDKGLEMGLDPETAATQAYGMLEQKALQAQSPEGQLLAQMEAAREEQRRQAEVATRYAAQAMAPLQAQTQKIYQDLAAVRDTRLQNPALPEDARAIFQASNPSIDRGNLALISQASPLPALMQAYPDYYAPDNGMADQLMQLYLANLQYGGGGGGTDLASLLQQGALAEPSGV